jgi:hypothetical protein
MTKTILLSLLVLLILPLAACQEEKAAPTAHEWGGKWTGPEGTAIDITIVGDKAELAIQSLDALNTYDGMIDGNVIKFTRDGVEETVKSGTGEDTGMKWLVAYHNCLFIKQGEGFCRE